MEIKKTITIEVSKKPLIRCPKCKLITFKIIRPIDRPDNTFLLNIENLKCALCGSIMTGEIKFNNRHKQDVPKEDYEKMISRHKEFKKLGYEKFMDKYRKEIYS